MDRKIVRNNRSNRINKSNKSTHNNNRSRKCNKRTNMFGRVISNTYNKNN